jgi:predicted DNA-binding ribbon-helix-helix protein
MAILNSYEVTGPSSYLFNIGTGHHMMRKTMRISGVRTSIKLESEFWDYLKAVADQRHLKLSGLVNEVAAASPERKNLASTLRKYALVHVRLRAEAMQREIDKLALAGNTQDLACVLEACPLPALMIDGNRMIRQANRAFGIWLTFDSQATVGQRLDNIMILRTSNTLDTWSSLLDGRMPRVGFNAIYISPGTVRTGRAVAVALSAPSSDLEKRNYVVMFETLLDSF